MRCADHPALIDDPLLRGGGLVLSPAALQEWLSRALGTSCRVEARRLRWKPGTSAVLAFDLTRDVGGVSVSEACIATAWSDPAATKMAKAHARAPQEAHLALDGQRHVLVTTATGDTALPLMRRLSRPGGADRLLARLGGGDDRVGRASVRTVRHNPARRWVGVLEREDGPPVLLRAYTGSEATSRAAAGYRCLGHGPARTPLLLTRSRSWSALAVGWADGTALDAVPGSCEHWRAAGEELAALHDTRPDGLPRPSGRADLDALVTAARQVAVLAPDLGHVAAEVARRTSRELVLLPRTEGVVHADFSPDQVVVGPDGRATIIDLDSARRGAHEEDLGCLAASVAVVAEDLDDDDRGTRDLQAFLAGYEDVRRPPDARAVALHAVAFRLRKAVDPFRECAPDWHEQVTARVHAARRGLEQLPPAGRSRSWTS